MELIVLSRLLVSNIEIHEKILIKNEYLFILQKFIYKALKISQILYKNQILMRDWFKISSVIKFKYHTKIVGY